MKNTPRAWFENVLLWLTFAILAALTYARFGEMPYLGFDFNPTTGEVNEFYVPGSPASPFQRGNVLLQIGDMPWEVYEREIWQPIVRKGQATLDLVVRSGETPPFELTWTLPGFNAGEFLGRLALAWLPWVFWGGAAATLLFLRPKDIRWRLLIAFNCLTAIWLIAGLNSRWNLWGSAVLLRAAVWLSWPVYWHLHWHYPRSLGRTPKWMLALYPISLVAALADIFQWFPASLYAIGFLLAFVGSMALLVRHSLARPEQRRDLTLLAVFFAASVLPAIGLAISSAFAPTANIAPLALLALPLIPIGYLYVSYRRRLGTLEARANTAVTILLFSALLFFVLFIAAAVLVLLNRDPVAYQSVAVAGATVTGLLSIWSYPRFQRWVERRLLGMPQQLQHLLADYSRRVMTSLDQERLNDLWRDEVLPTLLIRQAALLRLDPDGGARPVFTVGVETSQLPAVAQVPALLDQATIFRPSQEDESAPCAWARLILPLGTDSRPVGLCLLGRRDPDDYYAPNEVPALQSLADQTALALLNIEQANRLHVLYRNDIDRQEAERARLAHDLHDDALVHLAVLRTSLEAEQQSPRFSAAYDATVARIREIISGLRPAMLSYGLYTALEELADETEMQVGGDLSVTLALPPSEARYPAEVELHLYRIVQQACRNALRHAQARSIRIEGELAAGSAVLLVSDDGVGFAASEKLDLAGLLEKRRFGLAGMYERAALVGAHVAIESALGAGTRVRVVWEAP